MHLTATATATATAGSDSGSAEVKDSDLQWAMGDVGEGETAREATAAI